MRVERGKNMAHNSKDLKNGYLKPLSMKKGDEITRSLKPHLLCLSFSIGQCNNHSRQTLLKFRTKIINFEI